MLRVNPPMRRKTSQCAFIFSYLYDTMRSYSNGEWAGGCDGCTTYDEGEAFVGAFAEMFPGRKPDPKGALASKRLRRLMAEMHADGWLYRRRLSNHDQYFPQNEPNWQFVYRLHDDHATKIKLGHWNPEYLARRYLGDGQAAFALLPEVDDAELLRDANAYYSQTQIKEMQRSPAVPEGDAPKEITP